MNWWHSWILGHHISSVEKEYQRVLGGTHLIGFVYTCSCNEKRLKRV